MGDRDEIYGVIWKGCGVSKMGKESRWSTRKTGRAAKEEEGLGYMRSGDLDWL